MKKNLIIFVFIYSLQTTYGQSWCPAGAKWTYNYSNNGTVGYVDVIYSGDTLINSINCKKRQITQHLKGPSSNIFQMSRGMDYTYEQNGVVYIGDYNNFDTLYNFKASIGDSWKMTLSCDSTSNITVLDTGTIIINSIPLKFLAVNLHFKSNNFPSGYQDTIIEKIGFKWSYYIAADRCKAIIDAQEGGAFRCYSDNNFNTYKPHYTKDCDFIVVGIDEPKQEAAISLYPNPASDFLTISTGVTVEKIKSIEFYNSFGQSVLYTKQTNNIDIAELPNGLYFIKITNSKGLTQITKLLKV